MKEFFERIGSAQVETINHTLIGRVVLDGDNKQPIDRRCLKGLLGLVSDKNSQWVLACQMHHNSPLRLGNLEVSRGVSAYYTWDPQRKRLIIEWGEIKPDGTAKLHNFLNQAINFGDRSHEGMTILSGHMAEFKPGLRLICLIDSLSQRGHLTPSSREYPIVKTLVNCGTIVIGSDGYPIVLNITH